MATPGSGGNAKIKYGSLSLTGGTAAQIPFPTNSAPYTGMEGAIRHITPGGADIFVGDANVTTANGYRIPANTPKFFMVRDVMYAVCSANTTITWLEELN